jgi:3-deoxy-D-manno-octulosonate 8-phosphate phosphatase (KDO 8-P phosphatase)
VTEDGPAALPAALVERLRLVVFDFDGVFTDNLVYVFEDGREAVRCTRLDGLGLKRLREAGIASLVLSTETNPVVVKRCAKLGIECIAGCEDKPLRLRSLLAERGIDAAQVAYVGNDINDAGCLEAVGLPIVVADAAPEVVGLAKYRTRTPGGHGAVREVCDLIWSHFRRAAA